MSGEAVSFIRKDGRIIPIRAASGASRVASKAVKGATHVGRAAALGASAHAIHKSITHKPAQEHKSVVKVKAGYDAVGLGTSIASGAIAAATFSMGAKGFFGGSVASHALDAIGIGANVASVAGKGKVEARAKQGAKQEARNLLVGNGVFAAGLVAIPANRKAAVSYAKTGISYAKKGAAHAQAILSFARKALRVV